MQGLGMCFTLQATARAIAATRYVHYSCCAKLSTYSDPFSFSLFRMSSMVVQSGGRTGESEKERPQIGLTRADTSLCTDTQG